MSDLAKKLREIRFSWSLKSSYEDNNALVSAADLIEQQQARIAELEKERDGLAVTVNELRFGLDSARYGLEITGMVSGEKSARELLRKTPQQNLNALKREVLMELLQTMVCSECTCDRYVEHYATANYPTEGE